MTIPFSKLLASARSEDGSRAIDVPEDWMQGRSVFGGLQAAFALQAMRALVPDAPLRTLQVTFIAPVAGSMRVRARVLRTGKNATHVEAQIGSADALQALVIGVFGTARSSQIARMPGPQTLDPAATPGFEIPFGVVGAGPSFLQHFRARWHRGQPPFTGGRDTTSILDLAIDDDAPANEITIVAITDFIPPVALSQLNAPAPGSTLTWMLELLADRIEQPARASFRIEAEMVAARDGYTNQAVRVFSPTGEPLALSHQSMLVFA